MNIYNLLTNLINHKYIHYSLSYINFIYKKVRKCDNLIKGRNK